MTYFPLVWGLQFGNSMRNGRDISNETIRYLLNLNNTGLCKDDGLILLLLLRKFRKTLMNLEKN